MDHSCLRARWATHAASRSSSRTARAWTLRTPCSSAALTARRRTRLRTVRTLSHASITHGNVECAAMLIKNNADVDRMGKYNMTTLLQCACYYQHVDIAKLLLKHGADVNLEDDESATPLINAVCNGSPACVRLMLSARADVTVVHNGRTALEWARYFVRDGPQIVRADSRTICQSVRQAPRPGRAQGTRLEAQVVLGVQLLALWQCNSVKRSCPTAGFLGERADRSRQCACKQPLSTLS